MVSDCDFYITFSSNTSLLIKIGIITINTFLPTRYKFAYTCSIKINALRFGKLLECIFWILLVVAAFSLQKIVKMHEELVVSWQEVRWIWWMRQTLVAKFTQLSKFGCVQCGQAHLEKNWAHSVDQCRLWSLQFSVHLNNLMSILLRCNDFTRIPKTVVDQASSRPPNSDLGRLLVQV